MLWKHFTTLLSTVNVDASTMDVVLFRHLVRFRPESARIISHKPRSWFPHLGWTRGGVDMTAGRGSNGQSVRGS